MCGHDGHTVCLLGFAAIFMDHINKIPKDRSIRLIFQPAEEGVYGMGGGAKIIIAQGGLDNVDEAYGLHNMPTLDIGYL